MPKAAIMEMDDMKDHWDVFGHDLHKKGDVNSPNTKEGDGKQEKGNFNLTLEKLSCDIPNILSNLIGSRTHTVPKDTTLLDLQPMWSSAQLLLSLEERH